MRGVQASDEREGGMTPKAGFDIADLRNDHIRTLPLTVEWVGGEFGHYGNGWDIVFPDYTLLDLWELIDLADNLGVDIGDMSTRVETNHDLTVEEGKDEVIEAFQEWQNDDGVDSFFPMMNYAYPIELGGRWSDEAARIFAAHLPLTIIETSNGDTYLALTGGGMDLSWEICRAYMICGYLPPVHYAANLPNMAMSATEARMNIPVGEAAVKSCIVAATWADADVDRARRSLAKLAGVIVGEGAAR